jgi:hypothetical protein
VFTKTYIKRLVAVSIGGVVLGLVAVLLYSYLRVFVYGMLWFDSYDSLAMWGPTANAERLLQIRALEGKAAQLILAMDLLESGLGCIGVGVLASWGCEYVYQTWRAATRKIG